MIYVMNKNIFMYSYIFVVVVVVVVVVVDDVFNGQ